MPRMTIDGIEVINAAIDAIVKVTEKDVLEGVPMDVEACPLALGGRRSMPGALRTKAYKSKFYLMREIHNLYVWERYDVPKSLMIQEAIIDNGGRFSPGTYVLKAPPKSKRTGKEQGSKTRPPKDAERDITKREYHKTNMRVNAPTRST